MHNMPININIILLYYPARVHSAHLRAQNKLEISVLSYQCSRMFNRTDRYVLDVTKKIAINSVHSFIIFYCILKDILSNIIFAYIEQMRYEPWNSFTIAQCPQIPDDSSA